MKSLKFSLYTILVYALLVSLASEEAFAKKEKKSKKDITAIADNADTTVYETVDQMPSHKGKNLTEFKRWAVQQIRYPKEAIDRNIEGIVLSEFIIEKDGSINFISILASPHVSLNKEILRVLHLSPRWEPAINNGVPVRIKVLLPFHFKFTENDITPLRNKRNYQHKTF